MKTRIEITKDLNLSDDQVEKIRMHSFFNVMNVLMGRLQILEEIYGNPGALKKSLSLGAQLIASFSETKPFLGRVTEIEQFKKKIKFDVDMFAQKAWSGKPPEMAVRSLETIKCILDVVEVRVGEILARAKAPGLWKSFSPGVLKANIRQVLEAIARNSNDRYKIVYRREDQRPEDYLVNLDIGGPEGAPVFMPPVLQDSLRDLIANARKYTEPGGSISCVLKDEDQVIRLLVSDTGRGIPVRELADVVDFGYRGSNCRNKVTMGGGFGLTKAYYVCKRFNGRMWIASEPGFGTTIEMKIPGRPF